MSGEILTPRAATLARIKALVLDTLPSPESKRAYSQALDDFFRWCEVSAVSEFSKATVNAYRASLEERKLSASTINQRLSAVRKLALEAADNGLMPATVAAAISRLKGAKRAGVRTGSRLKNANQRGQTALSSSLCTDGGEQLPAGTKYSVPFVLHSPTWSI